MNTHNLHEFIKRYEENINLIYGDVHDELFKWQAMKVWRDEWFKPDTAFASFADRFNAARKEFSLLSSLRNMRTCAASISRAIGLLSRTGTPLPFSLQ